MTRKRVVTSKPTRNGCRTCRLRRIKCDEARPQCSKCSSSGRGCVYGVRVLPSGHDSSSRVLLPVARQPSRISGPVTTVAPLRSLSMNDPEIACISSFASAEDRNAYDYFLKVSLAEIASTSPSGSEWIQFALQRCKIKHIFHAIAAVGNAHASISRISHSTLARFVDPSNLNAAMRQYGKAVSALQEFINDVAEAQADIEPVLLACCLLACYEILLDGRGAASSHYSLGRQIVNQSLETVKEQHGVPSSSLERLKHLEAAFHVFGRGGEYYWNEYDHAIPRLAPIQPWIPRSMPTTFSSFMEADVRLGSIVSLGEETRGQIVKVAQDHIRRIHGDILDPVVSFCLANCLSKSIDISELLQHRLSEVRLAHARWLHMLRLYTSQRGPDSNQILLLTQIRYFASWLAVSTCRETREVAFDLFEPEFVRTLSLAEQYFRNIPGHILPVKPPRLRGPVGLSLEGGILPALHLIACKSRSSAVRQRAADILINADRLEGSCYSGTIGLTVGCAADLEEVKTRALQGGSVSARQMFSSNQIPEEARIADFVIKDFPCSTHVFRLACARYLHDRAGHIEVMEYRGEGFPVDLRLEGSRVFDCS